MTQLSTHRRTALIFGVNGQDGSYLAERLLETGWHVIGIGRQDKARLDANLQGLQYHNSDIADTEELIGLMEREEPTVIYYTAATHGAAGYDYEAVWKQNHIVNTLGLNAVLEYGRMASLKPTIFYFGSAKMFGALDGLIISESTPARSECLYSISKNAGAALVRYYRDTHAVPASVIWLFNHDSVRRKEGYFVPKIVSALRAAKSDNTKRMELHSLDFWADIGHSQEYMNILVDHHLALKGQDIVMATGHTLWMRSCVNQVFQRHGLNADDHFDILVPAKSGHQGPPPWRADIEKLNRLIGNTPQIFGSDLFDKIMKDSVNELSEKN